MNKPDPAAKTKALAAAESLREAGDTDGMAHYLFYLHDRNQKLEAVYDAIKHYLHSGMAVHELSVLKLLIEKTERAAYGHEDVPSVFGSDS